MSTEIPPQNATVPLVAAAPTFGTFPGASVMSECLRLQAEVLPRSPLARFPVRGAIVIVGAREIKVREQPDDVAVVAATQLARWLRKQRPHFDATQYAMVSTLVRDAATWTQSGPPAPDLSRFDALRREVAGARRVRMLWGGTLLVGILAITAPMAITYYSSVFGG